MTATAQKTTVKPCTVPHCDDPLGGRVRRGKRVPPRLPLARFGLEGVACERCYDRLRYAREAAAKPPRSPRAARPCCVPGCPDPLGGYRRKGRPNPARYDLLGYGLKGVACSVCRNRLLWARRPAPEAGAGTGPARPKAAAGPKTATPGPDVDVPLSDLARSAGWVAAGLRAAAIRAAGLDATREKRRRVDPDTLSGSRFTRWVVAAWDKRDHAAIAGGRAWEGDDDEP